MQMQMQRCSVLHCSSFFQFFNDSIFDKCSVILKNLDIVWGTLYKLLNVNFLVKNSPLIPTSSRPTHQQCRPIPLSTTLLILEQLDLEAGSEQHQDLSEQGLQEAQDKEELISEEAWVSTLSTSTMVPHPFTNSTTVQGKQYLSSSFQINQSGFKDSVQSNFNFESKKFHKISHSDPDI